MIRALPNILTCLRLFLSVPLAYCLFHGRIKDAILLLVLAGITDLSDGFLARLWNCRTKVGAWLDPAADKLIITTVLMTLTVKGTLPIWFCVVTLFRDIGLVVGTFTLIGRGYEVRIQPYLTGKLATVAQNLVLIAAILQTPWPRTAAILPGLLYFAAALTLLSAYQYTRTVGIILRRGRSPRP